MRGTFLLLLGLAFAGCDCNKTAEPAPKADTSTTKPASTASAPQTTDEEDLCKGQPYARRCDQACKDAQQKAFNKTCAKETAAFSGHTDAAFGKCMTACRVANADSTCVGAPDRGACDC